MRKKNQGFTLIEVAVSGFLAVALLVGLAGIQYIIGQNQLTTLNVSISVDEANATISTLAREIRAARQGDNGAYPIETADDYEIAFYSDIDFDGETEKVHYFIAGNTLTKETIEPTGVPVTYPPENAIVKIISENVRNLGSPMFYYYNGDWPQDTVNNPLITPADLSDIRLVRTTIRSNTRPSDPNTDYLVDTFTQIRMLKDNL